MNKRRDVVPENLLAAAEANFSKVYKLHDSRAAAAAEQADKPTTTMTTRRSAAEDAQEDQEEEEDALQGGRSALINKWEATGACMVPPDKQQCLWWAWGSMTWRTLQSATHRCDRHTHSNSSEICSCS